VRRLPESDHTVRGEGGRMRIVQLKLRTNIPSLDADIWVDTTYDDVKTARKAWPDEVYHVIEVVDE
jgi:hypothetical protein